MDPNFIAIGRISGECIFIHKDDTESLNEYDATAKIKCIAIDFEEKKVSTPVIIDILLKFCPHEGISSEGERSVMNDLVLHYFYDSEILALNKKFERIKCAKHQTGKATGYQSSEPQQTY
jgi:hypothetical protein